MKDHDEVVRTSQDMKAVCKMIAKIEKKLDNLDGKLDDVIEKKVSHALFFWVIGGIISSILLLGTFTVDMNKTVIDNKACIRVGFDTKMEGIK